MCTLSLAVAAGLLSRHGVWASHRVASLAAELGLWGVRAQWLGRRGCPLARGALLD